MRQYSACPFIYFGKLLEELKGLERDATTGKIDHPSKCSKDISGSLAGVVFGITKQRLVWAHHGVSLMQLPSSIAVLLNKAKSCVSHIDDGR
jgi:hypothetical protein